MLLFLFVYKFPATVFFVIYRSITEKRDYIAQSLILPISVSCNSKKMNSSLSKNADVLQMYSDRESKRIKSRQPLTLPQQHQMSQMSPE